MSFWTDEQKGKAAKLWNDGASATEVAHMFGCSRNAVIGLAHRNRDLFANKPVPEKQARPPRPEPMARPFVIRKVKAARGPAPSIGVDLGPSHLKPISSICPAAPVGETPDTDFVPANPLSILGLTHTTCRWPLWAMGDNPGAAGLYCGETTDGDSAWCRHHRLKARVAA